jgi:hypothetical protein
VLTLKTFYLLIEAVGNRIPNLAADLIWAFERRIKPRKARGMSWGPFDNHSYSTIVKILPRYGERAAMAGEVELTVDDYWDSSR